MGRINAVIFDLDNVLFDEKDYIFAAYREIAKFLSANFGFSKSEVYQKLVDALRRKTSMYPRLFNDLLSDLGLDQKLLARILKIFSSVRAEIRLFAEAESLIKSLREKRIKLGLVTNGSIETQQNKVRILGLEKYFDKIVYAREIGKTCEKPNPEAYLVALEALGVVPEDALCIGDNPHTDFLGAKKLEMRTVRFLSGEFKDVKLDQDYEADLNISNLNELSSLFEESN